MWKKYLIISIVIFNSPVIGGRRKKSDSTDCRRTKKEAFGYCTKSCSSDSDCKSNQKCLCDKDCGLSCVRNNLKCEALPRAKNSRQKSSNGSSFHSVVTYTCKPPFQLRGSTTRTCRATGKWDGKKARCRILCNDPGDISYGNRREDGFQAGKYIQYWCWENYKLIGSAMIRCLETGEWSAPTPRCENKLLSSRCDTPNIPDSATNPRNTKKKYKYNDRVHLKCKDGFSKVNSGILTCRANGRWSGSISCSPKSCGKPKDVSNGKIKGYVYSFGSTVHYECNEGYKLNGPAYRICMANQKWGDSDPTCEAVNCGPLDRPDHGDIIEQVALTVGNRIVFDCIDKGYEMKGSRTRTCQSDGTWSGSPTTCEIVQCPDPGKLANGAQVVHKGFVYGGSVTFTCDKDYTLRGTSTIYCRENKQWSASVPRCLDCGTGIPLGMESGKIPDKSIKASSQKFQHPAHHGRLDGGTYWCSEEEKKSFIQIDLPKKYKITGTRIQLKSKYKIKSIILKRQIFENWYYFHQEEPPYSQEEEQITSEHPFIAQSIRIRVLRSKKESICLRAEVYGCGVPKGCILQGSAVLIKRDGGYRKGYMGGIFFGQLEIFQFGEGKSSLKKAADVILDEKANVHELTKGTLVLGEDVYSPGVIREGIIEQVLASSCTIKTNNETWKSNLNDVRIVKISNLCPS